MSSPTTTTRLVEALQRYHHSYGDALKVEVPVASGRFMNLTQAAGELSHRLVRLFLCYWRST